VGELQGEHAKRLEDSRVDLKRIQKAEAELAPKRAARVKIHKELMMLIPERAKVNSTKIAPLEAQLESLEHDDKELEQELGKLKREALKSSYDAQ
jgi:chromosome segregation ATPase